MSANSPHAPDAATPRMDAGVPDYSDPDADDAEALARDKVPVRSMTPGDLDALARIDKRITGTDRRAYFEAKLAEVMGDGVLRVSLVAEIDGMAAGFIMARVDHGDFGRTDPTAVIDTIGVDPGQQHHGVGRALLSQLLVNLNALQLDTARTMVRWDDFALLRFLRDHGFRPAERLVFARRLG